MHGSDYRTQFQGGVAFEYSLERANAASPYPFTSYGVTNYGVGYYEPENCDEMDVKCTYQPKPEFYLLKEQHSFINPFQETHKDHFTPETERTGRSTCTSQFPLLADFSWKADLEPDIECTQLTSLTCPDIPLPSLRPQRPTKNPTPAPIVCGCIYCTPCLLGSVENHNGAVGILLSGYDICRE